MENTRSKFHIFIFLKKSMKEKNKVVPNKVLIKEFLTQFKRANT